MAKSNNRRSATKECLTKANIGKKKKIEASNRDPSLLSRDVLSGKRKKSPSPSFSSATTLSSKIATSAASRSSSKDSAIFFSSKKTSKSLSKDTALCTPSPKKPDSKTLNRKIDFDGTVVPRVKLPPERINFFDSRITKDECFKYLNSNEELPRTQEEQLRYLLNQFSLPDLKIAFTIATTKLDKNAMKVYYPIPNTKKKLMLSFLGLVFDKRSIMADVSKKSYR